MGVRSSQFPQHMIPSLFSPILAKLIVHWVSLNFEIISLFPVGFWDCSEAQDLVEFSILDLIFWLWFIFWNYIGLPEALISVSDDFVRFGQSVSIAKISEDVEHLVIFPDFCLESSFLLTAER